MTAKTDSGQRLPTLAVIILNYNYAHYVSDAIESVLDQDLPFDDVIVVDDGSTDCSLEVIAKYRGRVRVIAKENGGQLSAGIAGLAATTAEYVYILDADDYVAPGFVRIAKPYLATAPAKFQFQLIGVDAKKNRLGSTFPSYVNEYGATQMLQDNCVIGFYVCPPTSGNIYRRSILTGLNLHRIHVEDVIDGPPALAMPYLGPVMSANEPIAYYRAHGGSHSSWDRPDDSLLQGEINRFYRRWNDVCAVLNLESPPFGTSKPLYVLERQLMQSALATNHALARKVVAFLRRLYDAHIPKKQKLILIAWALALLPPVSSWRRLLVFARRSPLNRPAGLQRLVALLTTPADAIAGDRQNQPPSPLVPHSETRHRA